MGNDSPLGNDRAWVTPPLDASGDGGGGFAGSGAEPALEASHAKSKCPIMHNVKIEGVCRIENANLWQKYAPYVPPMGDGCGCIPESGLQELGDEETNDDAILAA